LVLHAWWRLTELFRQVCDRLAQAGFVALAPDLYQGKTTASVEEAEALVGALNREGERVDGDLAAALQVLRQHATSGQANDRGQFGVVGFSLGGAYALDMSVSPDAGIAAVVTFYSTYPGLDYGRTQAASLCHFAEHDPYEPAESAAQMQREIQVAGRPVSTYTYPGTSHWFFEQNRPEYDVAAAQLAWERTTTLLSRWVCPLEQSRFLSRLVYDAVGCTTVR
ncbi:MAG TPA: dienelactone hydrolase family protein, partial [Ktedonobacteraceae bacterium]